MKRVIVGAIVIAIVMLCGAYSGIFFLTGANPLKVIMPEKFRQKMQHNLQISQEAWQQSQVHEYEISVTFWNISHLGGLMCGGSIGEGIPVTFRVRDDTVIEAYGESRYNSDICKEVYQLLTIDAMFEQVGTEIAYYDPLQSNLYIRFDSEWGYIVEYRNDVVNSVWSSRGVSGGQRFQVNSFKTLP